MKKTAKGRPNPHKACNFCGFESQKKLKRMTNGEYICMKCWTALKR